MDTLTGVITPTNPERERILAQIAQAAEHRDATMAAYHQAARTVRELVSAAKTHRRALGISRQDLADAAKVSVKRIDKINYPEQDQA